MFTPDAFVTELYVLVDDWFKSQPQSRRRGPAPALSPSETITLAIMGQFGNFFSERDFYRYAERHFRPLFPTLPDRTQFNRAVRRLQEQIGAFAQLLARAVTPDNCLYEIIDGTGIVTRNLKRRKDGWLAGEATIGKCTRVGWYEGVRLVITTTPTGAITGWGIAPANTNDRALADTLFAQRALPQPDLPSVGATVTGTYLADKGFAGIVWETHWSEDYHAIVIAPPEISHKRSWSPERRKWFAGKRQIIETTTDRLLNAYGLVHERPHSLSGLLARITARIALHNTCFYFNVQAKRPPLSCAGFLEW